MFIFRNITYKEWLGSQRKIYFVFYGLGDFICSLYHCIRAIIFPVLNEGHRWESLAEYRRFHIRYELLGVLRGDWSIMGVSNLETFIRHVIPDRVWDMYKPIRKKISR